MNNGIIIIFKCSKFNRVLIENEMLIIYVEALTLFSFKFYFMLFKLLLFSFNLNILFHLFFTRAKIIYRIEYEFELG